MSKRIYVGNLPKKVTEDTLRDMFGKFGKVDSIELADGSAKVEMKDGGTQAIQALHQKDVEGKQIIVKEEKSPR
jgi:RNA recognition motif-containing protein